MSAEALRWQPVCQLADIVPDSGVRALVNGEQVAIFRTSDDAVFALGALDPFSGAHVLSRGIVGDLNGTLVVASPIYKQHFALATGVCVEDETVSVPTWPVTIRNGRVLVGHAVRP